MKSALPIFSSTNGSQLPHDKPAKENFSVNFTLYTNIHVHFLSYLTVFTSEQVNYLTRLNENFFVRVRSHWATNIAINCATRFATKIEMGLITIFATKYLQLSNLQMSMPSYSFNCVSNPFNFPHQCSTKLFTLRVHSRQAKVNEKATLQTNGLHCFLCNCSHQTSKKESLSLGVNGA